MSNFRTYDEVHEEHGQFYFSAIPVSVANVRLSDQERLSVVEDTMYAFDANITMLELTEELSRELDPVTSGTVLRIHAMARIRTAPFHVVFGARVKYDSYRMVGEIEVPIIQYANDPSFNLTHMKLEVESESRVVPLTKPVTDIFEPGTTKCVALSKLRISTANLRYYYPLLFARLVCDEAAPKTFIM